MAPRTPDELILRIAALHEDGYYLDTIAKVVGVDKERVRVILKNTGFMPRVRRLHPKITAEEALTERQRGLTIKQIARNHSCSETLVEKTIRDYRRQQEERNA